jgi:hypothetical protein
MHSRFWTFCAAANIFIFLITLSVVYFNKDKAQKLTISLFNRNVKNWGTGQKVWYDFYDTYSEAGKAAFLPLGMAAVGCDYPNRAPICDCLDTALKKPCKDAGLEALRHCFMNVKPTLEVKELDQSLNPFALLDTVNMWGMMGSVVLWIRMYICKEDYSLPYWIQLVLGIFAALIHCSVLEPSLSAYLFYVTLSIIMSGLSYYHRTDKNWWLSMYMLQYAFTLPNITLLAFIQCQKRDMQYILMGVLFSIIYGLSAFGRALLDEASEDNVEMRGARNMVRCALVFILLALCGAAYDDGGHFYSRSAHTSAATANGFILVLISYLFLGLLCPSNLKRVVFADWAIRFLVSMLMMTEIIIN